MKYYPYINKKKEMEKFKIDITEVQFNRDEYTLDHESTFAKGSIDLDGNNIVEWQYDQFGPTGSATIHLITPDGTIDTDVEGYSDFCGEEIRDEIITEVIDRVVNDRVKPVEQ